MNKPNHGKDLVRPIPDPIEKPRPPEMDLEPIPAPDLSGADADERRGEYLPFRAATKPIWSRMTRSQQMTRKRSSDDDPAREKTRFDEEVPKEQPVTGSAQGGLCRRKCPQACAAIRHHDDA